MSEISQNLFPLGKWIHKWFCKWLSLENFLAQTEQQNEFNSCPFASSILSSSNKEWIFCSGDCGGVLVVVGCWGDIVTEFEADIDKGNVPVNKIWEEGPTKGEVCDESKLSSSSDSSSSSSSESENFSVEFLEIKIN